MIDFAGPPAGLEKLFKQYDSIVHHIPPQPPGDEPPWWTPEPEMPTTAASPAEPPPPPKAGEEWIPSPPLSANERAENQRKADLGYDPKKSWKDIEAERMEKAEQRLKADFERPSGATFKQDEEGLNNAYADKTAPGVYYDPETRTEYVKGSVTARDWYDDLTKVPFWGDTRNSQRYQQAERAYNDLIESGQPVDRVVGHSLGGSVALQMQKDHFIPKSRTFGAPVVDFNPFGRPERYRHPLDPVSIFDRGATWGKLKLYPHTYTDFEDHDAEFMGAKA